MQPNTLWKQRLAALLVPSAALAAGCGTANLDNPREFGRAEESIIGGTTTAPGEFQDLGVVMLSMTFPGGFSGGCSGTLLSNQFVLTAKHCVRLWNGTQWGSSFSTLTATFERSGLSAQTVSAASFMETVEPANEHWVERDYALVVLSQPMERSGRTDAIYTRIYQGTDLSLVNQSVRCMGYGGNTLATTTTFATGFGTLRWADLTVAPAWIGAIDIPRNNALQVAAGGDSGSTCFFNGTVTGVASGCNAGGTDIDGNGSVDSSEYSWISECFYASPVAHRAWTEARLFSSVQVLPFTFSPTLPAGTVVSGTLTTLKGASATVNLTATTTFPQAAVRSGWVDLTVSNEPAMMMCSRSYLPSPTSGDTVLVGGCVSDGLPPTVHSVVL